MTMTLNIYGRTGERHTLFQLTHRDACSDTEVRLNYSHSQTWDIPILWVFAGGCLSSILPS